MAESDVRILRITVEVSLRTAYEFACVPEHFTQWAAGLSSSLHRTDLGWIAETPVGEARVRFSEPNAFGVLDHWVSIAGKPDIYIPLRMVAHGDATEVELMLFRQPQMSDADFDRDTDLVRKDLAKLKDVLESL